MPNVQRDLSAQRKGRFQLAIVVAQEDHAFDAQHCRCGALLLLTHLAELVGRDAGIMAALVAVGDDDERYVPALRGQLSAGAARAELVVVGVRADHQGALALG